MLTDAQIAEITAEYGACNHEALQEAARLGAIAAQSEGAGQPKPSFYVKHIPAELVTEENINGPEVAALPWRDFDLTPDDPEK